LRKQIQHLATRHAGRSSSPGELDHQLGSHLRFWMRLDVAENFERKREQGIACQNRGCFIIGTVNGRLSAPQIVIVHARQIVVNERMNVNAFHSECCPQGMRAWHFEKRG
jgi:hypothetical protein